MSVANPNPSISVTAQSLALVAAGLALLLISGCQLSTDIGGPCGSPRNYNSGNDPCAAENGGGQFYYTSGIAVDPGIESPTVTTPIPISTLYVSNSNADLRYSGGTVMAVDIDFFECALAWARAGYAKPLSGAASEFQINNCLKAHPNLTSIHDASANINGEVGGCRVDLSDPSIIECDEDIFITSSVRVGNFAGSVRVQTNVVAFPVNPDGTCTKPLIPDHTTVIAADGSKTIQPDCTGAIERLWVPVRGDPSITFVNVINAGGPASSLSLSCIDPSPLGTFITQPGYGVDASGNAITRHIADNCTSQRVTTRDFHDPDAPGFYCSTNNTSACVNLPAEPFGIYLDQGLTNAAPIEPYARLLVTSQSTGEITLINASAFDPVSTQDHLPSENVVFDVRSPGFSADSSGRRGTFGIAPQHPGDPASWWYVTSRLFPQVAMFRLADADVILPGPIFTVAGGAFSAVAGNDNRDIVFDPTCPSSTDPTAPTVSGCRAFVVENNPPSVYTVDTRIDPGTIPPASLPRNEVVDIVSICQGPSHLYYHHALAPGAEGQTSLDRIYVNCFTTGQILVVDPDLAMISDNVLVGRGTNEMTFNFGFDEVRQKMLPEPAHRRAYVTDFLDSNIAVLDLDPGSATENRVIGRIGLTDPPRVQAM